MVKFSHGCWHPAPDTIIDWAVETVKAKANDDSLHFVTVRVSNLVQDLAMLIYIRHRSQLTLEVIL